MPVSQQNINRIPSSTETHPTFLPYKSYQGLLDYTIQNGAKLNLNYLFSEDPNRFQKFNIRLKTPVDGTILIDYSKNLVTTQLMDHLFDIADKKEVIKAGKALFSGEIMNFTEQKQVLHTALRNSFDAPIVIQLKNIFDELSPRDNEIADPVNVNVTEQIFENLLQMENFTKKLHCGNLVGFTGKPITDVVNISTSTLSIGPEMVIEALKSIRKEINCHFCINGIQLLETLTDLNYETTLFIIVSRNFSDRIVLAAMQSAKDWLLANTKDEKSIEYHFVAVSKNIDFATEFGINSEYQFKFWDWVNDRFSLWSAVGLTIPIAIGFQHFLRFLDGARFMDQHFKTTPMRSNAPIILALLSIYYTNFCNIGAYAVLPYDEHLKKFPIYIQQLEMQSNGKSCSKFQQTINYQTSPIIWGDRGMNCQYSIGQLINQSSRLIPCDFIACAHSIQPVLSNPHHKIMLANFIGQTESLLTGASFLKNFRSLALLQDLEELAEVKDLQILKSNLLREARLYGEQNELGELNPEIAAQLKQIEDLEFLSAHKTVPGSKPTNSIVLRKLTPFTLGALIALYEHKIFVQGIIWDINSFDNYSEQLVSKFAAKIEADFDDHKLESHDKSTVGLRNFINLNFM